MYLLLTGFFFFKYKCDKVNTTFSAAANSKRHNGEGIKIIIQFFKIRDIGKNINKRIF